jgi:glycosyltransferase involved in cell wall biosynthesis
MVFGKPKGICKPDIIIYSSLSPIGAISAELLAKFYKVPFVYEVRDIWPLTLQEIKAVSRKNPVSLFLQLLQDRAYRNARLIISSLPGVGTHIDSRNIFNKEFLWLPNGCGLPEKLDANEKELDVIKSIDKDLFTIGYVGSFGYANRMLVLLEAAKYLLISPNIKIILIGSGSLLEEYSQYIIDNSLTNVSIFGKMSRNSIFEAYKKFDVCYIGWGDYKMYDYGTSANKLSEYMIAGKPILNSYSGKYDFVKENNCGITVDSDCSKDVANAILQLYSMQSCDLDAMGENALRFAKNTFDYDDIAKTLECRLLKEINALNTEKALK